MPVTLSAKAELRDGAIYIEYEVANSTDGTIHLVNVIERWNSEGLHADSNIVYTQVVDGTLWLTKANLSIPDNLDVEAPDVPLLTPVETGAAYFEEMTLDLPLSPYHPYDEVEWSSDVITYDDVALAIGWLPAQVVVRTGTRPDGKTVMSARHQDVVREQQLVVMPLPVAVPTHLRPRVHR